MNRIRPTLRLSVAALAAALSLPLTGLIAPADAATAPSCAGHRATIVGTAGHDRLVGTPGRDVIVGLASGDVIDGRGGDDLICGNGGHDVIRGGPGNDVVHAGTGSDRVSGGPGNDVLKLGRGSLSTNGVPNHVLSDPGNDVIVSIAARDHFDYRRARAGVTFDVGAGVAFGRSIGHDVLRIRYPELGVWVDGARGDNALRGGPGPDQLYGGCGHDTLTGNGGGDALSGNGATVVLAGTGDDGVNLADGLACDANAGGGLVHGGPGDDDIYVSAPDVSLHGDTGDDSLELQSALLPDEMVSGDAGTDQVRLDLVKQSATSTPYDTVRVDLAGGTLSADRTPVPLTGLENAEVQDFDQNAGHTPFADHYVMVGTDGPNHLVADLSGTSPPSAAIYGEGGDDSLTSGDGDDLLDGGTGVDAGDAMGGTDTCVSIESGLDGNPDRCESSSRNDRTNRGAVPIRRSETNSDHGETK
jgi:Ca2+-binding RTX toxin-like protein